MQKRAAESMDRTLLNALLLIGPVLLGGEARAGPDTLAVATLLSGGAPSQSGVGAARERTAGSAPRSPLQSSVFIGYPNPLDFAEAADQEAIRSGQRDASPAVAAAIIAAGGAILPCGTYRFDTPLPALDTDGALLRGTSRACTSLSINFAEGDFIQIGQPAGTAGLGPKTIDVGDFTITTAVPHIRGAAIDVLTHYDAIISRFSVDGSFGDELIVRGNGGASALTKISDFRLGSTTGSTTGACLKLTGYANDTYVSAGSFINCKQSFYADDASGIYLSQLSGFGATDNGFVFAPGAGQNINGLFVDTVLSDTSTLSDWAFLGTGAITEVRMSGAWGGAAGSLINYGKHIVTQTTASAGLALLNSAINGFTVLNGHFHGSGGSGILIGGGHHILIGPGTEAVMNNTLPGGTASGIDIASGSADVLILGVHAGAGGYMQTDAGLPNLQRYGVNVAAGAGTNIRLLDNDLTGNIVGSLYSGAESKVVVHGNIGFVDAASGSAIIASGQSCVTVPLAVDAPDSAVTVQFTPVGAVNPYSQGPTHFWVTPVLSSAAQICGDAVATAPLTFFWRAIAFGG